MKFVLDLVSNCDINQKITQHPRFQNAVESELNQLLKLCCSSFLCLCFFCEMPSSSLLIKFKQDLGVPPSELQATIQGETTYYVISFEHQDKKVPLLFTEELQIALFLLDELLQIYCTEKASINNNSSVLDNKARLWHKIYNLPRLSKVSVLERKMDSLEDEQLSVHELSKDLSQAPI